MELFNFLSLPEIPLTYNEIQSEIEPIEDDFFNQRIEYLKDMRRKIYEQFVEKFKGIKEDNDKNLNILRLINFKQWIGTRIEIFEEFLEGRKKFLSQKINIYPLKQKVISKEITFLESLNKDFLKRLENVEKLLQKCNHVKR